ncbi:MAG: hypothetical protein M0Q21_10060 [Ignavibacteriaceae bacterium]|nr:hypothetical protein [Ignavibacteriaceae bacterium]
MKHDLSIEFKYYLDHQDKLVEKYNNKFIVIKNQEVIGAFNSTTEAYEETRKEHELGTFLIQHCLPGKNSYQQTFHSRVVFQ